MSVERGKVLLLSGPQHYDERRPVTSTLRKYGENVEPLGIAIVSRFLKSAGYAPVWMEMNPSNLSVIEGLLEKFKGVWISSRYFDIDLAKDILGKAREKHTPTIVGGYGPTFCSGSFSEASSIVKGELEPIGNQLMENFTAHHLEPEYNSRILPPHDIENSYIWPDRSIYPRQTGLIGRLQRHSQEWERGCDNLCRFCSATRMQSKVDSKLPRARSRRVEDIISEIESIGLRSGDHLFSTDLNTMSMPRDRLVELFTYLGNKGIRWYTEGTVSQLIEDYKKSGEEDSLIRLMSPLKNKGGCYSFLYGADDLASEKVGGSYNKYLSELHVAVNLFRQMGIPLNLSVVVGLDNHEYPLDFFKIRRMLEEIRPPYSFLHVATPYQGTPWGELVEKRGRLNDRVSTHFNHRRVVHMPLKMEPEELQQGYYWLQKTLNSPENIAKTSRANFNLRQVMKDPLLGVIGMGLPWGVESLLASKELELRHNYNGKVQKELDLGYAEWIKKL